MSAPSNICVNAKEGPSRASATWPLFKRGLIRLLDRRGGRFLLGAAATYALRRISREDVAVRYLAGLWTRRTGPHFVPYSHNFDRVCSDFGSWEQQVAWRDADAREYWLRYYRPQQGDIIVDVGAGRGEDVLTFSRGVGETGRVLAIEADSDSFLFLRNFCRLNNLHNVVAVNTAVMDRSGRVRIARSGSSWTANSISSNPNEPGTDVRAETVDAICQGHGVREIAFLKMNVEGAELYALQGMRAIMPNVRQICVACHDFRAERGEGEEFRTRGFVEEYLMRNGFKPMSRATDPRDYVRDHVFGLR